MKRHISIFALLLSAFAAVGLTGTAEATLWTYYKAPDGSFKSDEAIVSPRSTTTPTQSSGKDITAYCPVGQKLTGWYYYAKSPSGSDQPQGQSLGAANPLNVKITDGNDYWLCAHFAWITYNVKYDANGGSGAPAAVSGQSYNSNFTLSSTKPTKDGYTFAGWKADTSKKTYSAGDTIAGSELCRSEWHDDNQTVTLTAQWTKNQYTISTAVEPTGAGSVTGGGKYDFGTKVTLTATANSGWQFEKWKDGSTDNPRTVTVDAAGATYTAVFKQLTVAKPTVTKSFTYDGTQKTCASAGSHYTVTGNTGTNVGEYTFTAKLTDGYAWSDGSTADYTVSWTITAAQITGVTLASTSVTYDGQPHQPTVASVTANGKTFTTSSTGWTVVCQRDSVETSDFTNAGTITVKVTGTGNLTGSSSASFTIGKKEISMDDVVFANLTVTYDGTEKTIKASNVPSGVTATYSSNTRTTVGEQQARVMFEPNDKNHTVSLTQKFATLKIEQATITEVALNGTAATYDGQSHKPTIGWVTANNKTFSNSTIGWDVTYLRDGAATGDFTSPGTITVKATGTSNLKGAASATFTINKATIESVTLATVSVTYDGKTHQPVVNSVTASGKGFSSPSAGWDVAYTRGGAATTDFTSAGTITVTVTGKDGLSGTASATFTIGKKTISTTGVGFSDKSVTYDGTPKSITASSIPEGVKATYSNNSRTDAGSQTTTVNFEPTDTENCTASPTSKTATLTVTPAAITGVTLASTSVTYDGQPHQPQVVSVTANGKTFTDAATGWNVTYDNTDFTSVGRITVTATGKKNLTSSANTTFEIKSKSITVTFDPNGGNAPSPASKTVQYPGTYGTLATCTRKGYDLTGWWTAKEGGQEITSATSVESTAAQTLYARWKAKRYTLTIALKEGESYGVYRGPQNYQLPDPLIFGETNLNEIAVAYKKDDADFQGYFTSAGAMVYDAQGRNVKGALGEYWTNNYPIGTYCYDGNLTLSARFADPREHYAVTVTASPAEAGTVDPSGTATYVEGSNIVLTATENTGYSFWHWTKGGAEVSTAKEYPITVTADATYTAVFTGNVYKVSFVDEYHGSVPDPIYVTYGQKYGELPKSTYADSDLTFSRWLDENDHEIKSTDTVRITGKRNTFYADAPKRRESFDVTFVDLIGKRSTTKPYPRDQPIGEAPEETKAWDNTDKGYWQDPDDKWDPSLTTVVTDDMTVTAKWISVSDILDCTNLTFTATGSWKPVEDQTAEGGWCMRMDEKTGTDNLTATLKESGILTFHWKGNAGRVLTVKLSNKQDETHFIFEGSNWKEEALPITVESSTEVTLQFTCNNDWVGDDFCAIDHVTWTPGAKPVETYAVTYDKGTYGEGAGRTDTKTNDVDLVLAGALFTRDNYTQDGWSKNEDGSTSDYVLGGTYTENAAITLYPHWLEKGKYTVSYSAGTDATGSAASQTAHIGETVVLHGDGHFSRTGYSQDGWATSDLGEKAFEFSATYEEDVSTTLYPCWTNNRYTVTFNPNGGSVTPEPQVVTYDEAYGELPTLDDREGYKFAGWTMASGEAVTAATIVKTAADHELTAKWTKNLGPYSEALDCDKLKFELVTDGWFFCNETPHKGDSCLRSATSGAELTATITESGTLTFWWRGEAGDDMIQLEVTGNVKETLKIYAGDPKEEWEPKSIDITASAEAPVTFKFTCGSRFDGTCDIDDVTWTPEGGGEPTPGDPVEVTAAGVANGVFSLTISAESGKDYGVWTNADLTVDSWGLMGEPWKGDGNPWKIEWTILPEFPQLFFRAHKVEYK